MREGTTGETERTRGRVGLPGLPRGMEWGKELNPVASAVLVCCCLIWWRCPRPLPAWAPQPTPPTQPTTRLHPSGSSGSITTHPMEKCAASYCGGRTVGRHRYQLRPAALFPRFIQSQSSLHTLSTCSTEKGSTERIPYLLLSAGRCSQKAASALYAVESRVVSSDRLHLPLLKSAVPQR